MAAQQLSSEATGWDLWNHLPHWDGGPLGHLFPALTWGWRLWSLGRWVWVKTEGLRRRKTGKPLDSDSLSNH